MPEAPPDSPCPVCNQPGEHATWQVCIAAQKARIVALEMAADHWETVAAKWQDIARSLAPTVPAAWQIETGG